VGVGHKGPTVAQVHFLAAAAVLVHLTQEVVVLVVLEDLVVVVAHLLHSLHPYHTQIQVQAAQVSQ